MSALTRSSIRTFSAAAILTGMAAAFEFAAPAAQARPAVPAAPAARAATAAAAMPAAAGAPAVRRHRAARLRAYAWAAKQAGHPYQWGGTGPGFDCSGLVMMAYRHAGIRLPRTTTGMLASRLLIRVFHPRMGDLAFYGPGHVELFRRWGYTFGAHDAGSRVGLVHYRRDWAPTAFYRVRLTLACGRDDPVPAGILKYRPGRG